MRNIIVHYHFFKNAGSSMDRILKAHFGDQWQEREARQMRGGGWGPAEIGDYLQAHPEITVLSSHSAQLPVPQVPGAQVFPIVFVRHPIDRARSDYEFRQKQKLDIEAVRMAKQMGFAEYVRWLLSKPANRAIRNFQAARLAKAVTNDISGDIEAALAAVEQLPFVGLVEQFDRSLERLAALLAPRFPGLKIQPTRVNTTQRHGSLLAERIAEIREQLGDELYQELVRANQADLAVHAVVAAKYATGPL